MSLFDVGRGATEITLAALLTVEDTPELLGPQCPQTGIPAWSVMRVAFFRQIMADLLFGTESLNPPAQSRSWRAVGVLGRATLHNVKAVFQSGLRSDVLINTDAIGDELRNGRWFNRYADPFGDLSSGQAVVLADMFDWQWHMPRHNERVFYHAPMQVGAALVAKLPRQASAKLAEAVTSLAFERARSLIGWEGGERRRAAFTDWAARKIGSIPFRYDGYRRLLRNVQPQLLLSLAGCYGGHAPLIAAARDCGITTAEFQHGSISAGHDAYNFAHAIFTSDAYRRTLPQYLLTYGSWWSAQVSAPVERVAIGNPVRAERLSRINPPGADRRRVLILGDGIKFDLYLSLARAIARAVAGTNLEVVLRPHPLERKSVSQRYGDKIGDIRIDRAPDIYASFATTHTLISEVSTGLFEAVGLVDRIVLLNTARARFAYPVHPFAVANSVTEVIDWICGEKPPIPKVGEEDLWASEWSTNYARFLVDKTKIEV